MDSITKRNGFSERIIVILIALDHKKSGDISICQHCEAPTARC